MNQIQIYKNNKGPAGIVVYSIKKHRNFSSDLTIQSRVTSSKQTLINYKIWKIQVSLITCQLGSIMYSLNLRGRYPEDTLKIS
eukprot:403363349